MLAAGVGQTEAMRRLCVAVLLCACADDGGAVASNAGGAAGGGGTGGAPSGGAGGSESGGTGGEAGSGGNACSITSTAGTHAAVALGKSLAQGSLRAPHVLWDPTSQRYVVLFGSVVSSGFRTRVLTTTI